MSNGLPRRAPGGGAAWTVALALGYAVVSLLADPLLAVIGPFGVLIQPSAGLPVLFGAVFGPVGVAGSIAGVALESLYAGGGATYSVASMLGSGAVAAVAWVAWSWRTAAPDAERGRSRPLYFGLVTLAAAAVGNAGFGFVAAAVGGYPFASLAVEGSIETTIATVALATAWVLLRRVGAVSEVSDVAGGNPSPGAVRRCLLVAGVGLAWLAVASGVDVFVDHISLLPPAVVEQYLPHAVVDGLEYTARARWVEFLVQFGIAAVAAGTVVTLLDTDLEWSREGPEAADE